MPGMPLKKYREHIATIKAVIDEKRHQQIEDQWSDTIKAVDLIADRLDAFPEFDDQYVTIDTEKLPKEAKASLRNALSNLARDEVVWSINDHPNGLMQTTTRYRAMLEGRNIIVGKPKNFEKYRRDIVRILEFAKADGRKKFGKQFATEGGKVALDALKRKRVPPVKLPRSAQWEKLTLKFKEGMEDLEISYDKEHVCTTGYRDLGFYTSKRQQKPDRAWHLLGALGILAVTDPKQATPENLRTMLGSPTPLKRENVHQIKRSLVKRLCELFNIDDGPFSVERRFYSPRFKILPEAELRRPDVWAQGGNADEGRFIAEE